MRIVRNPIVVRLWRILERIDAFYIVPVVIAVAAFIIAVLAYFAGIR